jgi:hypothetical protein
MNITMLNTSILTGYGQYDYTPLSLQEVRDLLVTHGFKSAIGHQATAEVINTLLGIDAKCEMNRIMYEQGVGDTAIVFKLNGRPEEGKILTADEIGAIGYSWGLLVRTA